MIDCYLTSRNERITGIGVDPTLALIIGVIIGAGVTLLVVWLRRRPTQELARELVAQNEAEKLGDMQRMLGEVQNAFAELSQKALTASNEQFLQLAETRLTAQSKQGEQTLEEKKKLIDETVKQIATKLTDVGNTLQTIERDRRQAHGTLTQQLETTTKTTASLQATTAQLREALANPQRRGQWGERMAEDVLRLAGFVEGINYTKQTLTDAGKKPDFTFKLPQGRRVNMDVKFPLSNYLKYLDAPDDAARDIACKDFLRDVRSQIKDVTTRDYIDPAAGTVDYVLVFIPNEQVYSFIHEQAPGLLDNALQQRVVLCAPLTLYAMLAVIRQVAEHFRLEQTSQEILALLGAFQKEWQKYGEVVEKMGRALEQAMGQYEALTTTRTRQLERQLDRIDDLRRREQPSPLTAAEE